MRFPCTRRYRVARLLHTVAMRLQKHTRKLGSFQAWNKCLNHLLELARAHIEAVMFTNFLNGASKCEDLDARKSLKVGLNQRLSRQPLSLSLHKGSMAQAIAFAGPKLSLAALNYRGAAHACQLGQS